MKVRHKCAGPVDACKLTPLEGDILIVQMFHHGNPGAIHTCFTKGQIAAIAKAYWRMYPPTQAYNALGQLLTGEEAEEYLEEVEEQDKEDVHGIGDFDISPQGTLLVREEDRQAEQATDEAYQISLRADKAILIRYWSHNNRKVTRQFDANHSVGDFGFSYTVSKLCTCRCGNVHRRTILSIPKSSVCNLIVRQDSGIGQRTIVGQPPLL